MVIPSSMLNRETKPEKTLVQPRVTNQILGADKAYPGTVISLFEPMGALINFGYLLGGGLPVFWCFMLDCRKIERRKEGGLI